MDPPLYLRFVMSKVENLQSIIWVYIITFYATKFKSDYNAVSHKAAKIWIAEKKKQFILPIPAQVHPY